MTKLEGSIIELRKSGLSVFDISQKLGCSKSTVSYHVNKHGLGGVIIKRVKNTNEDFIKNIGQETINVVVNYRQEGKTYFEIQKLINISYDKISKICRIYNLNKGIARNNRIINDELINEIRNAYTDNISILQISKKFIINRSTVSKYCRDLIDDKVKNRPKLDEKTRRVKYVSEARKRRKKILVEYKGGKCELCGYDKNINALQFHHKDPDAKDFAIGGANYSLEIMKKEADKCILVCANCHLEIHSEN